MSLPSIHIPGAEEVPSLTERGHAFAGVHDAGAWEAHVRAYGSYGIGSVWFENAPPERVGLLRLSLASIRYSERACYSATHVN